MSHAAVLTAFGPPSVLQPGEVEVAAPGPGQIRIAVRFAGVGPTDLPIRAGFLKAFPIEPGGVLGFEAAGVVDAITLAGGPARVISLSDHRAGELGVRL